MIRLDRKGTLSIATLDRSDKANALTGSMLADIADIAEAAADAHALILTGTGKVFSAGADLAEVADGLTTDPVWERASAAIADFPGLTIAALNGTLAGGAFGIALACDLRIAVPDAEFFYPVMKRGYLPQPSDPGRLAALVGPAKARLLLVAGARVGVAEALTMGLIDAVADDAVSHAKDLAADVTIADRAHVAAIKRMFP
ncbi:MAG: enoyl-CoA hydratase/isomerase family protein [Pseudomonadota bacterium]